MRLLSIPLIVTFASLASGCSPFTDANEGLTRKAVLERSFQETGSRAVLVDAGVVSATLVCDKTTKKVTGTFEFTELDGRAPVVVAGETSCEIPGNLFRWYASGTVLARENYKADLIDHGLGQLLAKVKLTPTVVNLDNEAAARQLAEQYWPAIHAMDLVRATFDCPAAGENYRYVAYVDRREYRSGKLAARCASAHHNFTVGWRQAVFPGSEGKPALKVESYNGIPDAAIAAAFGEFVGAGPVVSKF